MQGAQELIGIAARVLGLQLRTLVRAGTAGFFLMAAGPYLSWESLAFLERSPGPGLRPLPLEFGRYRCRTGLVTRRSAEDPPPFRLLKKIVREVVLRQSG